MLSICFRFIMYTLMKLKSGEMSAEDIREQAACLCQRTC